MFKWLLAVPHYIVLAFLYFAFFFLSFVAFFGILITGRYPRRIFNFNVGVLRWSWRVSYYAYGALGTDRYPPFTLAEVADYPAKLEIAYPAKLSRGLVLVKWWLLAIPHYLIVGILVGGTYFAWTSDDWQVSGPGLIGLLAFIAGVALLFTGRYPSSLFDLILGFNRWVLRVAAYAGLMTDEYPPFRLDQGGSEGGAMAVTAEGVTSQTIPGTKRGWGAGSIIALITGIILSLAAVSIGAAGGIGLWADQTQRDDAGFLSTDTETFETSTHALVAENIDIEVDGAEWFYPADVLGDARIRVTATDGHEMFIGIADTDAAKRYLDGVSYAVTDDFNGSLEKEHPGGAPRVTPAETDIWEVSSVGSGTQTLAWPVEQGDWTVVAMNADAAEGISMRADAALEIPALAGVANGLIVVGGVLLLIASALVLGATAAARRKAG